MKQLRKMRKENVRITVKMNRKENLITIVYLMMTMMMKEAKIVLLKENRR